MKSDLQGSANSDGPIFSLGLGAAPVLVRFAREDTADPLVSYPNLRREGRPYNRWLAGEVLDPFLARWMDRRADFSEVAVEVAAAGDRGRGAFSQILPLAAREGPPSILVALSITANLLRSLTVLGEALVLGHPAGGPPWSLSREWCGLVPQPEDRTAEAATGKPPKGRPRAGRRGERELAGALACSRASIEASSRDAIETLRREIRRSGLFTADDLRQLQAVPPGTWSGQENKSGVVRLRKSSM